MIRSNEKYNKNDLVNRVSIMYLIKSQQVLIISKLTSNPRKSILKQETIDQV